MFFNVTLKRDDYNDTHHSHHAKGSQRSGLEEKQTFNFNIFLRQQADDTLQKLTRTQPSYLSARRTVRLHRGGDTEGGHAERSKHGPHLVPVSSERIPRGSNSKLKNRLGCQDLLIVSCVYVQRACQQMLKKQSYGIM